METAATKPKKLIVSRLAFDNGDFAMSENLPIPRAVFNSGLSPRARLLLLDFTNLAVDNYLFPSQAAFAKDYGCSKTTIGRAIKELIRAGLLVGGILFESKRRRRI